MHNECRGGLLRREDQKQESRVVVRELENKYV